MTLPIKYPPCPCKELGKNRRSNHTKAVVYASPTSTFSGERYKFPVCGNHKKNYQNAGRFRLIPIRKAKGGAA